MQQIFTMYNLKPETTREGYEAFSRDKDQTVVPHVPGVSRFRVFWVESAIGGPDNQPVLPPPIQVIETVEVASWSAFLNALETDDSLKALGVDFGNLVDTSSVRMLRVTQV